MTVVFVVNWFTDVTVIADTRTSWGHQERQPEDILRKLHVLGDSRKSAVLGVAGEIAAAQAVLKPLIQDKLVGYR